MTAIPIFRKLGGLPWKTLGLAALALGICTGCAYPQVGFGIDGGYGGTYYEPGGYEYGAWPGGFRVGPGHEGERGMDRSARSYRPAAASRRTPSTPSRAREERR